MCHFKTILKQISLFFFFLNDKKKRRLESQLEVQTRNAEDLRSALEQLRRESINEKWAQFFS